MNLIRLAGIGCLVVALCGCTKPFVIEDSSRFAATGTAFEGRATVYVMRDLSGVGIKWPVHVEIDGVKEGTLHRASYTRFGADPGRHVIVAHWNHLLTADPDVAVSSDFEAGKSYYFVIGSSTGLSGAAVVFGSRLAPLRPSEGARLVREYEDRTPGALN